MLHNISPKTTPKRYKSRLTRIDVTLHGFYPLKKMFTRNVIWFHFSSLCYLSGIAQCQSNKTTIVPVDSEQDIFIQRPLETNMTCIWNITAPAGNIISLYFGLVGQTINKTVCEPGQTFKVYDGPSTSSDLLLYNCEKLEKTYKYYKFYTKSSNALIEFRKPADDQSRHILSRYIDVDTFKKSSK